MTMGYFTDHNHQPMPEEVQLALASRYSLWERLTRFIATNYQIEGKCSFWGAGEEWLESVVSKKGQNPGRAVSAGREDNSPGCAGESTGRTGTRSEGRGVGRQDAARVAAAT